MSALSMAMPRTSRSITTRRCPMAMLHSPTIPPISRLPIIIRMRRTDSLPRFRMRLGLTLLLELSQALGWVLAEESLQFAGSRKQVTLITHDGSWGPASAAEEALRASLKKHGVKVL